MNVNSFTMRIDLLLTLEIREEMSNTNGLSEYIQSGILMGEYSHLIKTGYIDFNDVGFWESEAYS